MYDIVQTHIVIYNSDMSIEKIADLQRLARKGGYGLPHLLGGSMEMVVSQIKAAEDKGSPIALGFAPEVFYMVPIEISFPLILSAAKIARVPVATQLEHGRDFNVIMRAIKLGVSSVMFDGSSLPYEENIEKTREIVKIAHAFDVCVEAELGSVGGSALRGETAKESFFTDPEMALDFVRKTDVDSLAISFGNVHGKYKGKPDLDYDRVSKIASLINIPLVMHGGSGLEEEQYRKCIDAGISNIHFYTNVTTGLWSYLRKKIALLDSDPVYHEIVDWTMQYFYAQTVHVIEMLKSEGRVEVVKSPEVDRGDGFDLSASEVEQSANIIAKTMSSLDLKLGR
ncbi:MAG TPA: class II fructose-bisphosphate aldolase [Spirochaetia bacterium]|nr:class II fructose-bisphosphate aldolase [Spirochaetia bacterium]